MLAVASSANADPVIGDRWTPFRLKDTLGQTREWRPGRVTVISFCAYWCDTWKQQVPRLAAACNSTSGLPVDYLTVSIDGRWVEIAKNNEGLPLWLDSGGEWSKSMGINRVPTTVVLDPQGEIRYVGGAVVRTKDITSAVLAALSPKLSGGTAYLTFDDFPSPLGSDDLLDTLRALDIKATFFCIGSRIESHAKLLKRALAEGHSLECHSWDHNASEPQVDRCRQAFQLVLGIQPHLYRAPGSEVIQGEPRHHPVVDPYDFQRPEKSELMRRVFSAIRDQSVIQFHAGVSVTLQALPDIVTVLRNRGFHFETLQ